jgi:two-component system nitrogen regulation response regulator GlnG
MATTHGTPTRDRHQRRPCESTNVLVVDRSSSLDHDAFAALEQRGFHVVTCRTSGNFMEEVVQHAPRVVVYQLRADSSEDLGVLQLMRRVAPDVPLILLAAEGSLDTQRLVQSLRPIYYAVSPIEPAELCEAVTAALSRTRPTREATRPRATLR